MIPFKCRILTPYRVLFDGTADSIILTISDGEIQFLAGHEPFVSPVKTGKLVLEIEGHARIAAVSDGLIKVRPEGIEVFSDAAEWAEEIDVERVRKTLEATQVKLAYAQDSWEKSNALKAIHRAQNRLNVAKIATD